MKVLMVKARVEDYEKAASFIEEFLKRNGRSKQIVSENIIVFEALFNEQEMRR